ncbi:hypothetical protein [Paracoccus sp. (in: a-proteobacteria)]|uniref:hypothetical protein n=1 Tax=Paracoccus sp. TaxID=267 RepID=UPI003A8B3592
MTALTEFERLEAQGSWRETPDARLREVVVSVGDASLILYDPKSETPLSHWSLPAVTRLNPGKSPAIYSPRAEGPDETLEIDDPLMIGAIERVHRAIAARRAHPGRLRGGLFLTAVLAMAAAAVVWLPDALIRHAARIAPPAQARAVGEAVLADIARSTGPVCERESGQAVLDWIAPRLIGKAAAIRVVPGPVNGARHLPGQLYVIGSDMLAGSPGPEAAAGHLIAAQLAGDDRQMMQDALRHAGLGAVLRLMTLGSLPADALKGYGQQLLLQPSPAPDDMRMLAALMEKGISSEPYARSIDPTGQAVLGLIEADPFRTTPPPKPLLTAPQWLALQQICAG